MRERVGVAGDLALVVVAPDAERVLVGAVPVLLELRHVQREVHRRVRRAVADERRLVEHALSALADVEDRDALPLAAPDRRRERRDGAPTEVAHDAGLLDVRRSRVGAAARPPGRPARALRARLRARAPCES